MNKPTSNANDFAGDETNEEKNETDVVRPYAGAEGSKESNKSGNISNFQKSPNMSGKPELLVGDLVWSKIPGHAWWPSMVSYEPNKAVYFQSSGKGKSCFKYHVQFFGDEPQRGWVSDKSMVRFQGRDSFMGFSNNSLSKKDKALHSKQLVAWERALVQAEKALPLNRQQRKLCYVFKYNDEHVNQKGSKKSPDSQNKKKDKSPKKTSNAKPRVTRRSTILDKTGTFQSLCSENDQDPGRSTQQGKDVLGMKTLPGMSSEVGEVFEDTNCNLLSKPIKDAKDESKLDETTCQVSSTSQRSCKSGKGKPTKREELNMLDVLIGDFEDVPASHISKQLGKISSEVKKVVSKKKQRESKKDALKETSKKIKQENASVNKKTFKNKQTQTPERGKKKVGVTLKKKGIKNAASRGKIATQRNLVAKKALNKKLPVDDAKVKGRERIKKDSKPQKIAKREIKTVKSSGKKSAKSSAVGKKASVSKASVKEAVASKQLGTKALKANKKVSLKHVDESSESKDRLVSKASKRKQVNARKVSKIQNTSVKEATLGTECDSSPTKKLKIDVKSADSLDEQSRKHGKGKSSLRGENDMKNTRKQGLKGQKTKAQVNATNGKCKTLRSSSSQQKPIQEEDITSVYQVENEVNVNEQNMSKKTTKKKNSKEANTNILVCKVLPCPEIEDFVKDSEAEGTKRVDQVNGVCYKDIIDSLGFEAEIPVEVKWDRSADRKKDCNEECGLSNSENMTAQVDSDDKEDRQLISEVLEKETDIVSDHGVRESEVIALSVPSQKDDASNPLMLHHLPQSTSTAFSVSNALIDDLLDVKSNKYISGFSKDEIITQTKNHHREVEGVQIAWNDENREVTERNVIEELNHNSGFVNCTEIDVDRMFLTENAKNHCVHPIFENVDDIEGQVSRTTEEDDENDHYKKAQNIENKTVSEREIFSGDCVGNACDEEFQTSLASAPNAFDEIKTNNSCSNAIRSADELDQPIFRQDNLLCAAEIASDSAFHGVNNVDTSIGAFSAISSTNPIMAESGELRPNTGITDTENSKDDRNTVSAIMSADHAYSCFSVANEGATHVSHTGNEFVSASLFENAEASLPFGIEIADQRDCHAEFDNQSSVPYCEKELSCDPQSLELDARMLPEKPPCKLSQQSICELLNESGQQRDNAPLELIQSILPTKNNVSALADSNSQAEQLDNPSLSSTEVTCMTKVDRILNQVESDLNSPSASAVCSTLTREQCQDSVFASPDASKDDQLTGNATRPSLETDTEHVSTQSSAPLNDSLANSSSSLLSSPDRHSIESGKDIDESKALEGSSKRLRKRKTMSDFHVGLAFDAILSKRKRSPDKDNEAKTNASKKRRQTIGVPTKISNKDDKVIIDNDKTEYMDSETLKKRRGRPKKDAKQIIDEESGGNPSEIVNRLPEKDNSIVESTTGILHQPSNVPGTNFDACNIPDEKECSKKTYKKKVPKKMQADDDDFCLKKQIKAPRTSDKGTKRKSAKPRRTKDSDQVKKATDAIVNSSIPHSNNDGTIVGVPDVSNLEVDVGLKKTKRRESKKVVSYCETDQSEITSCFADSEDYALSHLISGDSSIDLRGEESVTKSVKNRKSASSAKKKRKQEVMADNVYPCDSTESVEVSLSGKGANETEKSSSPPKKKAKTSCVLEQKPKRKYNKKKVVTEKAANALCDGPAGKEKSPMKADSIDEQLSKSGAKPKRKYVRKKSLEKTKKALTPKNKSDSRKSIVSDDSTVSQNIESSDACETNEACDESTRSEINPDKRDRLESSSSVSEQIDDASSVSGRENEDSFKGKKESVCVICELGDGLVFCSGVCQSSFHPDCLGLTTVPEKFFCDECLTGNHSCFLCKETCNLRKCSQSACGKFYHEDCASKMNFSKFENNKLICPLHNCGTCSNEKDLSTSSSSSKKKLVRCVRCPTAYHTTSCLVAGCMLLNNALMVCDKHFVPNKNKAHHSHYNVSWCFVCSSGGMLVCCESCPAAFHPGCVDDLDGVPEESWQCDSCRNGKKPLYGDLVWVKYGFWRWWPAKICLPDEIPVRIQRLAHDVGEFPVMFFGSRDYCWLHSGRVFPYQEGDKGCKSKKTTGTHKIFQKALNEVEEAYKELQEIKDKQLEQRLAKQSRKPPPYKHIKTNRYITAARPVFCPSELAHCECSPTADSPCGPGSECLNRMLQIECDKTCPAGDKCQNQRFQKCQHVDCVPVKTAGCGWGLKTRQDIKKGDFVIEYVGELIDDATCRKRIIDYHDNGIIDYYFLVIDKDCIIDAYPKGNQSRFMNHSCDPNCDTQKWTVNGEIRVGLFANKDIEASSELMFNYNLDTLGNEKKACRCGSQNCSGFLGVRPKTQTALALKEKKKAKPKKKKKKDKSQVIRHEDECFACGDGGELIMCDKSTCSKCYHLKCLTLSGMPRGRWECPWHFCDVCGKKAHFFCNLCPNSFCSAHSDGQIFEVSKGVFVCDEHGDENGDDSVSLNNSLTQDASVTSSTQHVNQEVCDAEEHPLTPIQE